MLWRFEYFHRNSSVLFLLYAVVGTTNSVSVDYLVSSPAYMDSDF